MKFQSHSALFARMLVSVLLLGAVPALPVLADPPNPRPPGLLGQEERRLEQNKEYLRRHSDGTGKARPDLWQKGVQHVKQMPIAAGIRLASRSRGATSTVAAKAGAVVGVQWTQIGPAPLRIDAEQNFQGAGPDSGQVTDIAIDPRNTADNVVYIATNDGGVWKTTDGGTSWVPKTDYRLSLSMGALALDPGNPSIVYAGTGNLFNNGFFKGIGIYKSIDGGDSWSTVGAVPLNNKGVNRMVMPAPNVLLVATNAGLYRSIDGGLNFGNNSPSFNNNAAIRGGYITDLKVDTATPSTVYAAVNGLGIVTSTDSGATFGGTALFGIANLAAGTATDLGFISFAQSTQPNNTIYVSAQTPATCTKTAGVLDATAICAQVYKSTDTGGTWTNMPDVQGRARENGTGGCQCGYDQTIGVDPQDPNRVYIGYQELYASTNGGTTFPTPAISRNKIHWDHHAVVFSPSGHWGGGGAPTRMWIGTDGGVHSTTDGGTTFANLNEGIATNLFRGIDIGRGTAANNVYTYGGTQDTGTVEHRPGFTGNDWHLGIDGDGGPVAVDPCNANHAVGTDNGGYQQTTNGGTNWAGGSGFPAGSSQSIPAFDPNCGRVYIPVNTPVAGPSTTFQLFVSTDNGNNFTAAGTFTQPVTAIGTVKIDSNTLWLGMADGTLQRTSNALAPTPTWAAVTVPGAPGGQGVSGVAIDPANATQVVAVYPGFTNINPANRTRHAFMTTDNGGSWNDIGGTDGGDPTQNLPDLPLSSVVIDPGTIPHTIIVSSDAGVMRSANGGASWQVFGVGLPTVDSTSLQIDPSATPSLLRIGTYGRSVFELTSATGPLLAVNADLGFGTVPVGTNVSRVVQLFNVGSADLHISGFIRVAGSAEFAIIAGPATPVTVPPGGEVDFTVNFKPTSGGNKTATFQINSDDPFQPARQLAASGTGGAPKIAVNGDLTFGTVAVGLSASRVVQFFNVGTSDLHISGFVRLSGNPDFVVISGPATPVTVSPGNEVDFTVRFQPSSAGAKSAVFQVTSDDPVQPAISLNATGIGGTGKATFSSTSLAFGSLAVDDRTSPNTSDRVLTITNQAFCTGCDLKVTSLVITGPNAGDFSVVAPPPLPATIAAANALPLTLRFNPSDVGARSATLTVGTDDLSVLTTTAVALSGTGLIPAIGVAPTRLIFGPTVYDPVCGITCGSTLNEAITNTGQAELILDTLSVTGSGFSAPPATVPPTRVGLGARINLPVTFHPTGAAARMITGNLHIQDGMGPSPTSAPVAADVPLCGESVGRGIRVLAIDPAGTPLTSLKSLSLKSSGINPVVTIGLRDLTLTSINPLTSCQPIQFQYENQSLSATDSANKKSQYTLAVSGSGGRTTTVTFNLGVSEFKVIVVTVN